VTLHSNLNCGFLVSDNIPSEPSYSRMTTKLEKSDVLKRAQKKVIEQAIEEGFIIDDTIAIDTTYFEAHDQGSSK